MESARAPQHTPPAGRLGRRAGLGFLLVLGSLLALAPRARANIRIDEFGIRCSNGAAGTSFVELSGGLEDYFEPSIGLVFVGANGDTLSDLRPIFGSLTGGNFYYSNKFLIVAPAFRSYNPGPGNVTLTYEPDTTRGRVILYRQLANDTRSILHQLPYGGPGEVPAPPNGATIVRASANTFTLSPDGTPEGYRLGVVLESCYHLPHWAVGEVGVTCWDGGTTSQYVELQSSGPAGVLDPGHHLRFYDHLGALQADLANPFGTFAGTSFTGVRTFLLGSAALNPDVILPVTLDPAGGRVELVPPAITSVSLVSSLSWSGTPASPRPGTSLSLDAATQTPVATFATPRRFAAGAPVTWECYYDEYAEGGAGVTEMATRCTDGSTAGQFVETIVTNSMTPDPRFKLVAEDHSGLPVGSTSLFDHLGGPAALTGQYTLFGGSGFEAAAGLAPDRTLPFVLDPLGGRLSIAVENALTGALSPISTMCYGGDCPLPGPGQSLTLQGGTWTVTDFPTPTRRDGTSSNGSPCMPDHIAEALQIGELMTRCRSVAGSSFIELRITRSAVVADRFRLRHYDHTGALAWNQLHMLAGFAGQVLAANSHVLLVAPAGATELGSGDVPLAYPLDPAGGRLQLLVDGYPDGVLRVADEVSWGTPEQPAPAFGSSLVHADDGSWVGAPVPTPTHYPNAPLPVAFSHCLGECQPNALDLGGPFDQVWQVTPYREGFERFGAGFVDQGAGAMRVLARGRTGAFGYFGDDFTLEGPPPGTPVTFRAHWSTAAAYNTTVPVFQRGRAHVSFGLRDAVHADTQEQDLSPALQSFDLDVTAIAGTRFQLDAWLQVRGAQNGATPDSAAWGRLTLEFTGLPTGSRVTSCYGFESSPPVAVEIALADGHVEPGVAHLRWFAADERPRVTVERCGVTGEWTTLGEADADGQGYYAWDDAGVESGERYGWRLAWSEAGSRRTTPTAWFDVPFGTPFALRGVRPNPTVGASTLAFALDRAGDVRADVIDIAGRRVLERRWEALPAGEHARPLAREGELAPGVYLVRLAHGGRVLTTRVIVTR